MVDSITLYEFNQLSEDNKLKTVWDIGEFIENHISIDGIKNLYAINKFYVEVVYDAKSNKIIGVESFKTGKDLEKYLPSIEIKY
jgi:hypothetical protein|tara:strand:+ start:310 stop:561 length:252 start_codon:yes stop_codon:yes gene_type:complete